MNPADSNLRHSESAQSRNLVSEEQVAVNRECYGGLTFNAFPPEGYNGIVLVFAAVRLGDHAHVEVQSGRWVETHRAPGNALVGLAGRMVLRWHEWIRFRDDLDANTVYRIAEVEKPTDKQLDRYVTAAGSDAGQQVFA